VLAGVDHTAAIESAQTQLRTEVFDHLSELQEDCEELQRRQLERVADVEQLRVDLAHSTREFNEHRARIADVVRDQIVGEVQAAVAKLPPPPVGPRGERGADGRDAVISSPVLWKTGVRYARGTVVQYMGATYVANCDTEGLPNDDLSGFALLHDAIIPVAIVEDERGFLVHRYRWASGPLLDIQTHARVPRDAGVWDETRSYQPGDLLSHAGSLWIARRESTGERPGSDQSSLAWRLCVKRGEPGPKGERGDKGDKGDKGERGERGPKASKYPGLDATGGPR
jgi:hypothetical protein